MPQGRVCHPVDSKQTPSSVRSLLTTTHPSFFIPEALLETKARPQVPTSLRKVPHAQPHWRQFGKDAPHPWLPFRLQKPGLSHGEQSSAWWHRVTPAVPHGRTLAVTTEPSHPIFVQIKSTASFPWGSCAWHSDCSTTLVSHSSATHLQNATLHSPKLKKKIRKH